MESIIRTFLGFFLILAISSLGIGILFASLSARAAESYLDDCVIKIENSNFSPKVITACEENAASQGYTLRVYPKAQNGSSHICYARLEMAYTLSIPAIGINRKLMLCADAR